MRNGIDLIPIWYYNRGMPKFTLRLPDDLYTDLKELAEKETRSLHNLVIHILKTYIKQIKQAEKED